VDTSKLEYRNKFHRFQYNREQAFAPKFYKALKEQYQQFLTAYKSTGNTTTALMAISAMPIMAVLKPLYLDAGVHWGSYVYSTLPKAPKAAKRNKGLFIVPEIKRRAVIGFNQEMVDLINSYFEGDILNTSQGITETTRDLIRVVMQIANEEGRDLQWIEDQLTTESADLNRNRSRLIARTETVTATNQAGWFAAAKTGLLMVKEWLSASDNRVRPDHANVNGYKIGFEDYFTVGNNKMLLPGAKVQENGLPTEAKEVCNCRCVALYIPYRNMQGRLVEFDYGVGSLAV
jgi:hypothetical protein